MLPLPGQFDGRLVGAALHMPSDRFKSPIPVPYSPLCWGDNTGAVKRKQELSNTAPEGSSKRQRVKEEVSRLGLHLPSHKREAELEFLYCQDVCFHVLPQLNLSTKWFDIHASFWPKSDHLVSVSHYAEKVRKSERAKVEAEVRAELEAEFAAKLEEEKKKIEAAVRAELASPEYSVTKSWQVEAFAGENSVCNSESEA